MSAPNTNNRPAVVGNLTKVQRQRVAAAIAAKDLLAGSAGMFQGDKTTPDVYDLINLSSWFLHGKDQHSLEESERAALAAEAFTAPYDPSTGTVEAYGTLPGVRMPRIFTPGEAQGDD